ncbi:hypothetical protein IIA16_05710, partial [bacterium]|nr:hypothetical protein [bacterium]
MDWTRRAFLKAGGVALLSLGVGGSPAFLGRAAQLVAAPGPFGRRKTLVGIFQRGAMDGIMAVTPFRDKNLAELRPRLALSAAAGVDVSASKVRIFTVSAVVTAFMGGIGALYAGFISPKSADF